MRHLFFRQDPIDVNSTAGFTEALALAAGRELTDEERATLQGGAPDRDVSSAITFGPERDPATGQFAQKDPVNTPPAPDPVSAETPPPADAGTEPPAETPPDAYEQGYLKALGDQAEKLGEERARREALEQRLAALETQAQTEPTPEVNVVSQDDWESLTDLYEQVGGAAMVNRIANSDPRLVESAMDLWKAGGDPDIAQAHAYERQINEIIAQQNQPDPTPAQPERDAFVAQLEQERLITASAAAVMQELGDRAPALAPHLQAGYETASPLVKQAIDAGMTSNDAEQIKAAYREIVRLAEPLSNAVASTAAGEQRQQQVVAQKQAAQVATGSQRPVTQGQSGEANDVPQTAAEYEALKRSDPARAKAIATAKVMEAFAKTETTSVAEGLTGL